MFDHFKTKFKIITALVLLTLAGASYIAALYGIDVLTTKTSAMQQEIMESKSGEEKAAALQTLFAEWKDREAEVSDHVLTEDSIVGFIEALENLAQRSDVKATIDGVSALPYSAPGGEMWEWLSVVISTEGSWQRTYGFLSLLELLPYRSEVTEVIINRLSGGNVPSWHGRFTLHALKYKTP